MTESLLGTLRESFDWGLLFAADDGKLEVPGVYEFVANYAAPYGPYAGLYLVYGCKRRTLSHSLAQWIFPE